MSMSWRSGSESGKYRSRVTGVVLSTFFFLVNGLGCQSSSKIKKASPIQTKVKSQKPSRNSKSQNKSRGHLKRSPKEKNPEQGNRKQSIIRNEIGGRAGLSCVSGRL